MANIRQYETPALGLQPTNVGVDATAAAARRIGALYNSAASAVNDVGQTASSSIKAAGDVAVKYLEHRELQIGAAGYATLQDELTSTWNDTAKNADPNDASVAMKFREEVVEPRLQRFAESFNTEGGRKWGESHVQSLRNHLTTKTSADMLALAGIAVKVNRDQIVNRLSSTVRQDPSSVDFALKTAESSFSALAESSPNLNATEAARVRAELTQNAKEEIVKSFFQGAAEKNPDEAVRILESGKYADYLKGTEAKTIIGYARTNMRLIQSEARNARTMQDHLDKTDFHKKVNEIELSTIPGEVGESPTLPADYWKRIREIGQMPGAAQEPGRLRTMINHGEIITSRLNKPEPLGRVSHETTVDLLTRMRASDESRLETNNEIYKAFGDGKLSNADFNFLNKEFKDMRTPEGERLSQTKSEFLKGVEQKISKANPLLGKLDPDGKMGLYRLEWDLSQRMAEYRKAGKNPYDLLDPSKPDFMGSDAALLPYQKPLAQSTKDIAKRLTRPSINLTAPETTITGIEEPRSMPLRNPGESVDGYLKRIGAK